MTLALLAGEAPAFLTEVVALVAVGAAIAYCCQRLGLMPIVGFLLTGVAIGPNALGLVHERELVDAVAEEFEGVVALFADVLRNYSIDPGVVAHHEELLRRGGYAALLENSVEVPGELECELGEECMDRRRFELRTGAPAVGRALGELDLGRFGLELRGSTAAFSAAADLFRPEPLRGDAALPTRPPGVDTQAEVVLEVDASSSRCAHLDRIRTVLPASPGCEECLAQGHAWVHLRICMTCGHVGCCDDSAGRHATAHWRASGHPVIRSLEPGETWGWCFEDGCTP